MTEGQVVLTANGKQLEFSVWYLEYKCDEHYHTPSANVFGHPSYRHLSEAVAESVEKMIADVVLTRQVITSLRQEGLACLSVEKPPCNAK